MMVGDPVRGDFQGWFGSDGSGCVVRFPKVWGCWKEGCAKRVRVILV